MRHIKSREKFLNKNTINESLTNEVRFGGSYLGRLINSAWRLSKSVVKRLRIGDLPAKLKQELELLAATSRLKEDKKNLEIFKSIVDEKFFEEVKKSCKELDETESEKDKVVKLKGLIESCVEKKKSLSKDKKELSNSIDEFVKGLQEELDKVVEEDKQPQSQGDKPKEIGEGKPSESKDILSQNLNSLVRIISKVNNLETGETESPKNESKIFEFAPPSEPKGSNVGKLNEIKKKIKSGIDRLASNQGGVPVNDVILKNILSNIKMKENRKLVISLYRQIGEIIKTEKSQKTPLMLTENFILSDENKVRILAQKMAEFIKLVLPYKKFYKDLPDMGVDIQTFILSFEKIINQLNKSPKQKDQTIPSVKEKQINAKDVRYTSAIPSGNMQLYAATKKKPTNSQDLIGVETNNGNPLKIARFAPMFDGEEVLAYDLVINLKPTYLGYIKYTGIPSVTYYYITKYGTARLNDDGTYTVIEPAQVAFSSSGDGSFRPELQKEKDAEAAKAPNPDKGETKKSSNS